MSPAARSVSAIPMDPGDVLLPPPHRAHSHGTAVALAATLRVILDPPSQETEPIRQRLCEELAGFGLTPRLDPPETGTEPGVSTVTMRVAPGHADADGDGDVPDHPEGYRLTVRDDGIFLAARAPAGLFYATRTLVQWLRAGLRPGAGDGELSVPDLTVVDRPDLALRGVMLDVSRCRVPTLAELFRQVELLADLKLNQLQLYTEHTFAYRGHEEVWAEASPLTPAEIRALDGHCRRCFIELVPNQNSFGHLHRWLVHDRYRPLAEVPEGIEHPFSDGAEPFSLCPTDPRSLDLLADLYDQLFPCFTSRSFNAGLDETLDLGRGRSAAACAERGTVGVYLEFLRGVHELVRRRDHRMQFWGDVVIEDEPPGGHSQRGDRVREIPEDVIALEWGYEAGHPFPAHAGRYAASGLDFVLCPGTSSWSSLAGRTTNAVRNQAEAVRSAVAAGALGVLITDWGDYGHLQPPAVSEAPFAAGAAFAWNAELAGDPDGFTAERLPRLVDLQVFRNGRPEGGATLAEAALRLGDAHRQVGTRDRNGAALFFLLAFGHQDLTHARYDGLTEGGLARAEAEVERALSLLQGAGQESRSQRPDRELLVAELSWSAKALLAACHIGRARLDTGRDRPLAAIPAPTRTALAQAVGALVEEHAVLWRARSRPGGRTESVARLERTLALLR